MINTIFNHSYTNIAASPTHAQPFFQEEPDPTPIEVIIPLIEETWKDEEYALGEHYDKVYSVLSERAATLRRQQQRCSDPQRYEEIENELGEVEAELCAIALKFDASTEYPE